MDVGLPLAWSGLSFIGFVANLDFSLRSLAPPGDRGGLQGLGLRRFAEHVEPSSPDSVSPACCEPSLLRRAGADPTRPPGCRGAAGGLPAPPSSSVHGRGPRWPPGGFP